jgi:hypothetical protein
MVITSHPLDEVRHLRVTSMNPETISNLDLERRAAPHNAIVKHAWSYTVRDLISLCWTLDV